MNTAGRDASPSLDEVWFLARANERDIQRMDQESKNFVTTATLDLKLQAFSADLTARIDANTTATRELKTSVDKFSEDRERSRNRVLGSLIFPLVSGLVVSIVGALVLFGVTR